MRLAALDTGKAYGALDAGKGYFRRQHRPVHIGRAHDDPRNNDALEPIVRDALVSGAKRKSHEPVSEVLDQCDIGHKGIHYRIGLDYWCVAEHELPPAHRAQGVPQSTPRTSECFHFLRKSYREGEDLLNRKKSFELAIPSIGEDEGGRRNPSPKPAGRSISNPLQSSQAAATGPERWHVLLLGAPSSARRA